MFGARQLPVLARAGARALWAHRAHAACISLAMALGIAALTVIGAAMDGARQKALEHAALYGPSGVVLIGGDLKNRPAGQRTRTFTFAEADRLATGLPGVDQVAPSVTITRVTVRAEGATHNALFVSGSPASYCRAWDWTIVQGRDLTEPDVATSARVCLLGATPARALFGRADPVGRTIVLRNTPFLVVGVLERRDVAGAHGDVNDRIIVPITTAIRRFGLDPHNYRVLRVTFHGSPERMDANKAALRAFVREMHGLGPGRPDDFTVLGAAEALDYWSALTSGMTGFLSLTAATSLGVAGFVLANLLSLAVLDRRPEIGLKRALGWRSSSILAQLLLEALLLTLAGALPGLALGVGACAAFAALDIMETAVSWRVFATGLGAALAVGLLFGLGPARRAARLDPLASLKA
ncbi:MAG: ABC transporter permease [Desulfovibrionaceae bacterium]|jgi:putative ABC transport system permease protein|nr:ABC transporter permease [Desulfovibrionaceae bacterium]